jgi:hypothetical protein
LSGSSPGSTPGANTGGGSHVNGARDRAFNYTLDGIDINESSAGGSEFSPIRTNPDSLQELRVITSNATAEFGRSSGAPGRAGHQVRDQQTFTETSSTGIAAARWPPTSGEQPERDRPPSCSSISLVGMSAAR